MKIEDYFIYFALLIVSIIAGIVSIFTKEKLAGCEKPKCKFKLFLQGMIGSMFVAYLAFEFASYFDLGMKMSIAVGGFAAYIGTDALVKLEQWIEKLINKKIDKV
ncbi:phage holin family protein [Campylobacter sp. US33a]|uniref:phage holin family protein n=1 Tax=Campylobacter sp. US33a TaxID=2498120 RepID=UPI001068753B|nr:phage holin family protein [Campylobacter sp. US33a]TEY00213.1 hypothetical protein ELQ16_09590 [Campylobacter sp. US33a]